MKQLIRFSLEKRFLSRISIIANIVMFVVLGLAAHADYFISPQSGIINTVYLDSSTADYQSFFMHMRHDEYQYHVSNEAIKDNCAVIHLNEQWEIHSLYPLRQEIVDLLRTDIRLAREQHYREHTDARTRMFIDEYLSQNVVNVIDGTIDEDDGNTWIVLSVVYFLIMTYGSMIAGEVMYEKATNTLPLIMASIEISDHFWAKVLTGYLSLFIQGFLFFVYALFWLLERTLLEDISELINWISLIMPVQQNNMTVSIPVFQLFLAVAIIMAGIVTMQILILTVTCSFRNSEEAEGFQGPFYIVLMFLYYVFLVNGNRRFYMSAFSHVLSYLPVFSTLFMPCRILIGDAFAVNSLISLFTSLVFLAFYLKWYLPVYRKQILK